MRVLAPGREMRRGGDGGASTSQRRTRAGGASNQALLMRLRERGAPPAATADEPWSVAASPCACGATCAKCRGDNGVDGSVKDELAKSAGQPLGSMPGVQNRLSSRLGHSVKPQAPTMTSSAASLLAGRLRVGRIDAQEERQADRAAARVPAPGAGPWSLPSTALGDAASIRVHTDAAAARAARGVGARAVTLGRHIYFGAGQFSPNTRGGAELLTHEVAHVGQQSQGQVPAGTLQRQPATGGLTQPMLEQIARRLREAMQGPGTDESAIYAAFAGRTQEQVDAISAASTTRVTAHATRLVV